MAASPRPQESQQNPSPAHPVRQAGQGKTSQRRQSHHGQTETELGARQPHLVGDRCATHHMAEVPGHVAQGCREAELSESGGQCHQGDPSTARSVQPCNVSGRDVGLPPVTSAGPSPGGPRSRSAHRWGCRRRGTQPYYHAHPVGDGRHHSEHFTSLAAGHRVRRSSRDDQGPGGGGSCLELNSADRRPRPVSGARPRRTGQVFPCTAPTTNQAGFLPVQKAWTF